MAPLGGSAAAVGYSLMDSPAGLAGWLLVHGGFARWKFGADPGQSPTKDEVLDDFTRCAGVPGPFLAGYASVKTMVQFRGPGAGGHNPCTCLAWS